ncbi:hypothetical protein PS914_06579 [Pseudomonas fluorescens]|nr:hypothetical protein PS914_06579 [Pseudomonas fluorescens]
MGLEHHRATGGQCRRGVTAGSGKGQGKIARAKHRHRPEADAVLAQVGTRQRLAFRQGPVDAGTVEITAPQHLGEQPHLAAGATALALNPCGRQRGFAADQGDELIAQGIELIGHRIEKQRPMFGTQGAIGRVSGGGSLGGGVDFFQGGLVEIVGQGFAGAGVDALDDDSAGSAALTADVVVADNRGHFWLQ